METPLASLSVGMWGASRGAELSLLVLPASFVLLAGCSGGGGAGARSKSAALLYKQLGAKSPFSSGFYTDGGYTVAFEVPLDCIVGLDYSNPLVQPGRVVLECNHVRKREFKTLREARAYYLLDSLRFGSSAGPSPLSTPRGASSSGAPLPAATPPSGRPSSRLSLLGRLEGSGHALGAVQGSSGAGAGAGGGSGASPAPGGTAGSLAAAPAATSPPGAVMPPPPPPAAAAAAAAAASPSPCSCSDCGISGKGGQAGAANGSVAMEPTDTGQAPACHTRGSVVQGGTEEPSPSTRPTPTCAGGSGGAHSPWANGDVGSGGKCNGAASPFGGGSSGGAPSPHTGGSGAGGGGGGGRPSPLLGSGGSGRFSPYSRSSKSLLAASSPRQQLLPQPAGAASGALPNGASAEQLLLQAAQRSSSLLAEYGPQPSWPSPYVWTSTSEVYEYRTVIIYFTEPLLPQVLQPVIQGNERLLKLYESGLPSWAVFMPAYGLYYRPWVRTVTWLLYYAFSIFSLLCGFYDLYKNFPVVQTLLQRVMSSMWTPPAVVLQWLEAHASFRLSILLTYLFGKSEAFVQLMRWAGNIGRGLRVALQPATDAFGPPLAAVAQAVQLFGSQAWHTMAGVWLGVGSLLLSLLAPFVQLMADLWGGLAGAVAPVLLMLYGPVAWALAGWRHLRAAGSVLWLGLVEAGRGVAAGASAVRTTVAASKAVQRAAPDVASQVSWLYVIPADALELLHNSALKVLRALQTVAKFMLQVMDSAWRHRLTLSMRAHRAWRRGHRRVMAWLAIPGSVIAAAGRQLMRLVQVLLWLAVASDEGASAAAQQAEEAAAEGSGGPRLPDPTEVVTAGESELAAASSRAALRQRHPKGGASGEVSGPAAGEPQPQPQRQEGAAGPKALAGEGAAAAMNGVGPVSELIISQQAPGSHPKPE